MSCQKFSQLKSSENLQFQIVSLETGRNGVQALGSDTRLRPATTVNRTAVRPVTTSPPEYRVSRFHLSIQLHQLSRWATDFLPDRRDSRCCAAVAISCSSPCCSSRTASVPEGQRACSVGNTVPSCPRAVSVAPRLRAHNLGLWVFRNWTLLKAEISLQGALGKQDVEWEKGKTCVVSWVHPDCSGTGYCLLVSRFLFGYRLGVISAGATDASSENVPFAVCHVVSSLWVGLLTGTPRCAISVTCR